MMMDGKPLPLPSARPLRLPPHHRKLEADFTAFSFVAPEDIVFRHRLEGWDDEWVDNGTARRISYSRLPAGEYRLRVTARSPAGAWNPAEAAVAFVVEPFLWQTWWFRGGALALFTLSVVAAVRYVSHRRLRLRLLVLERESALHTERARIAKDIHDDLGASLTQISLLGKLAEHDLGEPAKAGPLLKQISTTAREGVKAVDEIVWAVNPRNDTVAHLLDYAGQHAVDFLSSAGIRCRVDFPEEIPPRLLPADARHNLFLVLKEALNNIVKHAGATEVQVQARLDKDTLTLSVEDNGRGFAGTPDNALSDGLRNMQQRLAELGGTCEVTSVRNQGTRVSVRLSLGCAARGREPHAPSQP
jgi:signal transduction histidine kinase